MKYLACLLVLLCSGAAHAKEFKRQNLIGMWEYVSAYTELPDGTRVNQFGEHPQGRFVIHANGSYSHIVMRPDLPRVASGLLKETTPEEAEAIAENVLSHFGTWRADEKDGTLTVQIEKSSFANFDDITQVRIILEASKTTLRYVNLATSSGNGAKVFAHLKRVK